MSNIILLRNDLKNTVATEYANQTLINSRSKTSDITNVIDAIIIDCGTDGYCAKCTSIYTAGIDKDKDPVNYYNLLRKAGGIEIRNVDGKSTFIDGDESGACYGMCHCKVQGVFNNSVFYRKTSDFAIKESDFNKVTENIKKKMEDSNPGTSYNSSNILDIVKNITTNLNSQTDQNIDQTINSLQIIKIKGFGDIKGVSMTACINVIMKAMVSNDTNISNLSNLTIEAIEHIKNTVNRDMIEGLKSAFKDNVKFFIIVGIGLGCMVIFLLFSYFWKALHTRV